MSKNTWPGEPGTVKTFEQMLVVIEQKEKALLSFIPDALYDFLSVEEALQVGAHFGKDTSKADTSGWTDGDARTPESIRARMAKYMREYGWPKAIGHRGISASRTLDKMRAWAWLAGDEDVLKGAFACGYAQYGAPVLAAVCEHYGWPVPDGEDAERMIAGRPCTDYPGCGCGG